MRKLRPASASLPARPGRPKDTAKRTAIIEAARTLFARDSFDAVTMEAVAAQAHVSKMTVYSHFTDKGTLFEAIVSLTSQQLAAALAPSDNQGDLTDRLTAIGTVYLQKILDPQVAAMLQTVPSALRANQALAWRLYEAGPGCTREGLTSVIAKAAADGAIEVDEPTLAAEDLLSLWLGCMPAQMAFGIVEAAPQDEIERRARRGTSVFLRAYRKSV